MIKVVDVIGGAFRVCRHTRCGFLLSDGASDLRLQKSRNLEVVRALGELEGRAPLFVRYLDLIHVKKVT